MDSALQVMSDIPFKKPFLAIEAVLYIACKGGPEPIRSSEIAQSMDVPVRYLEPMMQKLVRAHILRSVRGPKGGYLLAKERRNIPLSDIYYTVDNDLNSCGKTTLLNKNIIFPIVTSLLAEIQTRLSAITMQDLYAQAESKGIVETMRRRPDFTI